MQKNLNSILQRVLRACRGLPRSFGEHAFGLFLVLFTMGAVVAALLFYVAAWSVEQQEIPEQLQAETRFRVETFERIHGIWAEQQERVEEAVRDEPRNIFQP